jgi:hypothetical protein
MVQSGGQFLSKIFTPNNCPNLKVNLAKLFRLSKFGAKPFLLLLLLSPISEPIRFLIFHKC